MHCIQNTYDARITLLKLAVYCIANDIQTARQRIPAFTFPHLRVVSSTANLKED